MVTPTFWVTNIADDGTTTSTAGTIRWAVAMANASPDKNPIKFDTAAMGGNSITVLATLDFTNPVAVDGGKNVVLGTTASNVALLNFMSGNCAGAVIKDLALVSSWRAIQTGFAITVTGCNVGTDWSGTAGLGNSDGITLSGNGSIIGAPGDANRNVIVGNTDAALLIAYASNYKIQNNYIGVLGDGVTCLPNNAGVYCRNMSQSLIGGNISLEEGNVISGNGDIAQVELLSFADPGCFGNTICGNIIGLGADQTTPIANTSGGININSSSGNTIGLPLAGCHNVIAGNRGNGIILNGSTSTVTNTVIQNNYLGINALGNTGIANGFNGLALSGANGNLIGGRLQAGYLERNYIAGFSMYNVTIMSGNGNTLSGNWIGVDLTGNLAVNSGATANIMNQGSLNIIGGSNPASGDRWGNVISGTQNQIYCASGNFNWMAGNYVGLNAAGTAPVAGSVNGIAFLGNAKYNQVGGSTPDLRNVISGNTGAGILFNGANGGQQTVAGNYINTLPDGSAALATGGAASVGIKFQAGKANLIGGGAAADANFICADTGGTGVYLTGVSSYGNTLIGNYIGLLPNGSRQGSNLGWGIKNDGPWGNWIGLPNGGANNLITAADTGISVAGATANGNALFGNTLCALAGNGIVLSGGGNANIPAPVISAATSGSISGHGVANAYIEVFLGENNALGNALRLLGTTTAASSGLWSLTPAGYTTGDPVTALETDANNNTSSYGFYTPPTPTPTITPTVTTSPTATVTPTSTTTLTPTDTVTTTPTTTPSSTITPTHTPSPTETVAFSATPSATVSSTHTSTTTRTATPTVSSTATVTPTPTETQVDTATFTATPSVTATFIPTATVTLQATASPTPAATMTATPFNPAQALGKEALTYPNPARGLVHFAWRDANPDKVRIRVFNLLGEQVALIKADQPGQTLAWTTAGMAPGIYVYQVIITLQGTDKILPKAKLAILK